MAILIVIEIFMSIVTILLYSIDKKRAIKNKWRIKEAVLLIFPWLMGGIGGFVGIYGIRHKSKHWYFVLNNFVAIVAQFALFSSIIILL